MKRIGLCLLFIYCCQSVADVPKEQTELNIYAVAPVTPEPEFNYQLVTNVIPTDLNGDSTQEDLIKEVGKKTIRAITKSDFVKKSSLGKTADNIKQSTSTELASDPTEDANEIHHKMKVSLDPYKAEARLKYTGFFNCSAFYDAFDSDLKVEIEEKIDTTAIKIQHSTKEQNSTVVLGWTW